MSIQRSKPFMSDYLPEQEEPTDAELAILNRDEIMEDEYEIMEEDYGYIGDNELYEDEYDAQPDEYAEWQDYMGGDDWDHGQYDELN